MLAYGESRLFWYNIIMENFALQKKEQQESIKSRCEELFNSLHPDTFLEFDEKFTKKEFLDWVINNKNILLHGSNNQYIYELKPQLANCESKKFGNQNGVYATEDTTLPMFYAIKDLENFHGVAISEVYKNTQGQKEYSFQVPVEMLGVDAWSPGAIYLLDKSKFVQGRDKNSQLIDEYMSPQKISPLGKIIILPKDFDYFNKIQAIK